MISACPACDAAPSPTELRELTQGAQFSIPSISCAACIGTIERHFAGLRGVYSARVNATLKRVTVHSSMSDDQIVAELKSLGYDAYPLDQAALATDNDPAGRDLILRMGVAGFAMMNVMLLSVAVWSGATDATRDLFHLVSAMIALPAVIFSARPFFDHAAKALRAGRLNMDVPISLAIALAAGMSLFESLHGGAHAYFDAALSLTFFLLIGRYLEHRTKSAARSAGSELAALEVHTANRKIGNRIETVPITAIEVGDRIVVNAGVRVPVDGTLLSGGGYTDRSFLTGESEPVEHDRGAALCAGEINLGAPFEMMATAIGTDTRLSRIAALVETAENTRNSYTSLADKAARIYAPAVHLLAAVSFLGWLAYDGDLRHALNVAIAVLIITCPCALGLAVPAVSTAAISRLYKMGFLVKSGTALERLAGVKTMVFDKTGTLTAPEFSFNLATLDRDAQRIVKGLASHSSHPLSKAIASSLKDVEGAKIDEITEYSGAGISGVYRGQHVALGRASWLGAKGAEMVFAYAGKTYPLPHSQSELPGASSLAANLNALNIRSQIISGDSEAKTAALAQTLGFKTWLSRISPENKAAQIKALTDRQPVCMVGDGINDTAALAQATVSIAPGTALDATRNAADMVMVGEALGQVPKTIEIARKTVALSKQNFGIAILYNLIAVPVAIAGFATPLVAALAMSASSITVLINAMRVRY